jgi:hypothetical protein
MITIRHCAGGGNRGTVLTTPQDYPLIPPRGVRPASLMQTAYQDLVARYPVWTSACSCDRVWFRTPLGKFVFCSEKITARHSSLKYGLLHGDRSYAIIEARVQACGLKSCRWLPTKEKLVGGDLIRHEHWPWSPMKSPVRPKFWLAISPSSPISFSSVTTNIT